MLSYAANVSPQHRTVDVSAKLDRRGLTLLHKARHLPPNTDASKQAKELAEFTGLIAQDIDAMKSYSAARDLVIVSRLPDANANAYASEIQASRAHPKSSDIKNKTGAHGTLRFNGILYVSDTDLMCMHQLDKKKDEFRPIISTWDGKQPMSPTEQNYQGGLNHRLISKTQHGFNDNYVDADGNPLNREVGNEFILFVCGTAEVVHTIQELKAEYGFLDLENWHSEYEPK